MSMYGKNHHNIVISLQLKFNTTTTTTQNSLLAMQGARVPSVVGGTVIPHAPRCGKK